MVWADLLDERISAEMVSPEEAVSELVGIADGDLAGVREARVDCERYRMGHESALALIRQAEALLAKTEGERQRGFVPE